ncbi:MAG TPA: MoxR family ATPase, partial [Dehalococcoidia bacterium]
TMPLPRPFLVLATQNPIEYEGTFPLPEAQLDRFLLRLRMGYPEEAEEEEILRRFEVESPLEVLPEVIPAEGLAGLIEAVKQVHCEPVVRGYAVRVVRATRAHPALSLGASPRASLALFRAARALAAIRGRDYVIPDDVKEMAPHVLSHRVILSSQARLRGRDAEALVRELVDAVPVPVEG